MEFSEEQLFVQPDFERYIPLQYSTTKLSTVPIG
jgi:hypothetical protein